MALAHLPTSGDNSEQLHVAIIMDGNGRWAHSRGKARIFGHQQGADSVRKTIEAAIKLGVRYLTLYSFSSENWSRPPTEIAELMGLLRIYLKKEIKRMITEGIQFRVIGDRDTLPKDIVAAIVDAEEQTKSGTTLTLTLALSYGARDEIVCAARAIGHAVARGEVKADDITQDMFAGYLFTADLPDPDLLIRTSGEQRVSNFLLWQLAYTELVFVDKYWPDFGEEDLSAAIEEYGTRERRYGRST